MPAPRPDDGGGCRAAAGFDPAGWGKLDVILKEAARITLAIAIVGITLRLPEGYPLCHWHSLTVLLGLLMPLM